MGLIEQIGRLFGRGQAQADAGRTTSDEMPRPPAQPLALSERMRGETDRRSVVAACREMYRTDPRARGVIRTLARDMVRGGFTVEAEGPQGVRAEEGAEELIERLGLAQRLDDWVRLTLRDGDSFLELSVNGRNEIVEVTRKPTLQVRRNSGEDDRFTDPTGAFWMADEIWMGMGAPADALWFAEWQMIHARWDHDEGSRYGSPLFEASLGAWKRVREGELDMAVRRKTRAGVKYLHKFPQGSSPGEITAYREQNRDTLDNPMAAIADYFGTVDISILQGDATLDQFGDVMHHVRTWWLSSPVPMSLLGYGQDLNRDVLQEQQAQYRRALDNLTSWVEIEIVVPLLERQWLLMGIVPEGLGYEIKWPSTEVADAATLRDAADAAVRLLALGVPAQTAIEVVSRFVPGVDLSAPPRPPTLGGDKERATPERMAEIADKLGGGQ